MRKRIILGIALCLVLLSGCGKTEVSDKTTAMSENEKAANIKDFLDGQGEETDRKEEESLASTGEQSHEEEGKVSKRGKRSNRIQEDAHYLYVCGETLLYKIDKENGDAVVLWESEGKKTARAFDQGAGLLVGERLYFFEEKSADTYGTRSLSVIGTDGTGYQELLTELDYSEITLYMKDNKLYLSSYNKERCFEVQEDGTLGNRVETVTIPEGYSLVHYTDNGPHYLCSEESKDRYGYFLLSGMDENIGMLQEDGTVENLPIKGTVVALEEDFLVLERFQERQIVIADLHNFQSEVILSGEKVLYCTFLGTDENYVYYGCEETGEAGEKLLVNRVSIAEKEVTTLFSLDESNTTEKRNYRALYGWLSFDAEKRRIYYVDGEEYRLHVMERSVENSELVRQITPDFYDSEIGQVGEVEHCVLRHYSSQMPEVMLLEMDVEQLVVDKRFPGADKINEVLRCYMDSLLDYGEENVKWIEEELENAGELLGVSNYSISSRVSDIKYVDEKYCSFYQEDYVYLGGAHGMPYHVAYVFDLETGEQLTLSDVVANSEEEIKQIAVRYFDALIQKDPTTYWEDALETVAEYTTMESYFYLTEEGIVFFFEPYAISSYAAGFQEVTIPYEEFEMKIEL